MTKIEEIWKDIPNASGYQVSNYGNVRSVDRYIAPGKYADIDKIKDRGKRLHTAISELLSNYIQ